MLDIILIIIGFFNIALVFILIFRGNDADLSNTEKQLTKLESAVREEFSLTRTEQAKALTEFDTSSTNKILRISEMVDKKLTDIQHDNGEKINQMQHAVNEHIHKTLEERLTDNFKMVQGMLDKVQQGLGEMQGLATNVGDLKRVLTNVKTRGTMGEIQLKNILEEILTPDQYAENVVTNPNTRANVEFAIKMPGHKHGDTVFLPVDAKFPLEDYSRLQQAYEQADTAAIETCGKSLEAAIKKCAKDISEKYIYPPATTDFGVLFLPVEGLYAEIARRSSLLDLLQREYKVIVAGPTTFSALLNSLQLGFRTLAIEKRSSEVWKVLAGVKTEFEKFAVALEAAQKKINEAGSKLDDLTGVRSRQMIRQLAQVERWQDDIESGEIDFKPIEPISPIAQAVDEPVIEPVIEPIVEPLELEIDIAIADEVPASKPAKKADSAITKKGAVAFDDIALDADLMLEPEVKPSADASSTITTSGKAKNSPAFDVDINAIDFDFGKTKKDDDGDDGKTDYPANPFTPF
ncbi:MAG: DNA recombination protein RmuC [Clostridiales bacterium]|jgi:DNA recombination protein RmuC|nr:DNA recombination protein RmuC [Clostridiales bacterium]